MPENPTLLQTVTTAAGGSPLLLDRLAWPQVRQLIDAGRDLVILPLGATEQHGPHLPINTDSVLASACCWYASAKTGVPVLPTVTYGCSLGHTDRWPGTVSLMPETLIASIREIAEFLRRTGWKRLLIVNAHWGNTSSVRCAIDRVRYEHAGRFQIGLRNTFELTKSIWSQFIDDGEDFHANRAETALMLHLDATSVRREEIVDDPDRTMGKIFTYTVPQTSTNGVTGHPSRANVEDGRKLFVEMGDALAKFVMAAQTEQPPLSGK
jgi:creatinine amidohydrolase